jgi:hypothetical protein
VTITGGNEITGEPYGNGYGVLKRELAASLSITFQTGRLQIHKKLKLAGLAANQIQDFHVTLTDTGRDRYGVRAGHDDIVLSLAMVVWLADHATI